MDGKFAFTAALLGGLLLAGCMQSPRDAAEAPAAPPPLLWSVGQAPDGSRFVAIIGSDSGADWSNMTFKVSGDKSCRLETPASGGVEPGQRILVDSMPGAQCIVGGWYDGAALGSWTVADQVYAPQVVTRTVTVAPEPTPTTAAPGNMTASSTPAPAPAPTPSSSSTTAQRPPQDNGTVPPA